MSQSRTRQGRLAVFSTASGGAFLAMLDSTVTNLAIPDVKLAFPGASVTGLSWIITAYAVMFAAFLAPAGKLADTLGRRRLFVIGVGLFTLSSLLCALSPSLPFLILARGMQGAGAAAMIPASLAILLLDGPADRRASSIGLWSAASATGAAVGPVIGGALVELFNWRAVFLINIPFGIVLVFTALRLLEPQDKVSADRLPDLLGTALTALGVGALVLGVTEGGDWGWHSARILGSFTFGVFALGYALLRTRRHPIPAIDTKLWGDRTFAATNVVSLLYGMAQYPFILVGVLYVTDVWHYNELEAGLANTPGGVSAAIIAVGAGRLAAKLGGPRFATLFGLLVFGVCSTWLIYGLTVEPAFVTLWLPAGLMAGMGMGAATMGTSATAALSAPPVMFASASGLNATARQFGGAIGIAATAAILDYSSRSDGGTNPYSNAYAYCACVLAAAFVIAVIWLKPAPAPAAQPRDRTGHQSKPGPAGDRA